MGSEKSLLMSNERNKDSRACMSERVLGSFAILTDAFPSRETSTVLKPGDLATPKGLPSTTEPKFRHVLSPTPTPWSMLLAARNPRFQGLQPGQRVEVSPESWATARKIGELVAGRKAKEVKPEKESDADREKREQKEKERRSGRSQGGAGLVVDYGDEKAFGASFRVGFFRAFVTFCPSI